MNQCRCQRSGRRVEEKSLGRIEAKIILHISQNDRSSESAENEWTLCDFHQLYSLIQHLELYFKYNITYNFHVGNVNNGKKSPLMTSNILVGHGKFLTQRDLVR